MAGESQSPVVVKVGGSLYDLPDLGPRLSGWLGSIPQPMLVPGGGAGADVIRNLDAVHRLGETVAHRLALQVLRLNAHLLAALLADSNPLIVPSPADCPAAWDRRHVPILDVEAFARLDESRPGCVPHTWEVTSDSLAARIALVAEARRLVLLKSMELPAGIDWVAAGQRGLVDPYFARALGAAKGLEVHWLNFRVWQPGPTGAHAPGR